MAPAVTMTSRAWTFLRSIYRGKHKFNARGALVLKRDPASPKIIQHLCVRSALQLPAESLERIVSRPVRCSDRGGA